MPSIDDVPQVRQETIGEGDVEFLFRGRRFRDRASANQARQVEINSILAEGGAGGAGARGGAGEGASAGLRGEEFRTSQQLRAEAELAKQLGKDRLSEVTPPEALKAAPMDVANITERQDQFLTTTDKLLGEAAQADVTRAAGAVEVEAPTPLAAPQGTAATIAGQEAATEAARTAAPSETVGDIQGTVSAESLATAATEGLDEEATVTFQLEQLFKGFKPGETPPPWATAPIRRASNIMLQRGLGASSMAAAAISQSIMEAGIPLAQQDAQAYATIQLANLNNKQQAALQNAATYAAMDTANLDARLTAAVENSRSFLQIDIANLNNAQQANVLTAEARNQFLLSDQAAENAMEQLNVQTQSEYDRFFEQLGAQIRENNANRITAVEQFNAGQANTISVFNAKQRDLREKYNTDMQAAISATNAQWRRQISTINNANQMAVNAFNAREVNDMNIRDYNNLYQTYRDVAARIFTTSESNEQRATQLAATELQAAASGGRGGSGGGGGLSSLVSAAGSIASIVGAFSGCYVAQEVYGIQGNEWIKFRHWMYHQSPRWFKSFYIKHGKNIAIFISDKPRTKSILKYFMDKQIKKVSNYD